MCIVKSFKVISTHNALLENYRYFHCATITTNHEISGNNYPRKEGNKQTYKPQLQRKLNTFLGFS